MDLWHASKAGDLIGEALVPCCLGTPDRSDLQRVSFFTSRAPTEYWNASRFHGRVLYRVSAEDVADLQPHEHWPHVFFTRLPVPLSVLEVVERREGPTPQKVRDVVTARAMELGLG